MLKAIKIRIYPSEEQAKYIAGLLGTCRFVYNNLLSYRIEEYNANKKFVSFGEMGKRIVELKSQFEWIKLSHSKALQQSAINLDTAYKSFFKNGTGFPQFKSKHDKNQSCRFPADAFMGVRGNRIDVVRPLRDVLFRCSKRDERYLNKNQENVRSATLSRTASGNYFLSILVEGDFAPKQTAPARDIIGIDLGINDFIVTSDGERFDNLKVVRSNALRLARLQRMMSRKQKGSNNKNKARKKLARLHEKLNNQKEFYLHAVSNKLLDENQVVAMEDLNVKGMMQNRCLARSIQELSLHRFRSMLEYKAAWRGRDLIVIDRFFPSSKLCGACGKKNDALKLNNRSWMCACGARHDRDLNAAKNIAKEGRRLLSIGKEKGCKTSPIGPSSAELKPLEMATSPSVKKEKNVAIGNKR
jgi:putative transposase